MSSINRGHTLLRLGRGSNPRPTDYESLASKLAIQANVNWRKWIGWDTALLVAVSTVAVLIPIDVEKTVRKVHLYRAWPNWRAGTPCVPRTPPNHSRTGTEP